MKYLDNVIPNMMGYYRIEIYTVYLIRLATIKEAFRDT